MDFIKVEEVRFGKSPMDTTDLIVTFRVRPRRKWRRLWIRQKDQMIALRRMDNKWLAETILGYYLPQRCINQATLLFHQWSRR